MRLARWSALRASSAALLGCAAVLAGLGASAAQTTSSISSTGFDERTEQRILRHAALPTAPRDETNRVEADPEAVELGRALFFDAALSSNGKVSCASCHDPARSLADGKTLAQGLGTAERHAPSLWNVAQERWLFWDGRADSLWAQALQPLENPLEMDGDRVSIVRRVASDTALAQRYERLFGALPSLDGLPPRARPGDATSARASTAPDERARAWNALTGERRDAVDRAFANVGKVLAAFERTFISDDSVFDRFARALRDDDATGLAAYPDDAKRGLALFVGRGNCRSCHAGPMFSDGEFHNVGVPPLDRSPPRDDGRRGGLQRLKRDPFNAAGRFSDAPEGSKARELSQLVESAEAWGQFKTPSLRNVALTAPYMHQGQFATLDDVLHFYSTLEGAVPAGHHGETILKPLNFNATEVADLKAFLATLSDDSRAASLAPARR